MSTLDVDIDVGEVVVDSVGLIAESQRSIAGSQKPEARSDRRPLFLNLGGSSVDKILDTCLWNIRQRRGGV